MYVGIDIPVPWSIWAYGYEFLSVAASTSSQIHVADDANGWSIVFRFILLTLDP